MKKKWKVVIPYRDSKTQQIFNTKFEVEAIEKEEAIATAMSKFREYEK